MHRPVVGAADADLRGRDPARHGVDAHPEPTKTWPPRWPGPATPPASPRLRQLVACRPGSSATEGRPARGRRIATLLAAKGGIIADITVGDCLELLAPSGWPMRGGNTARTSTSCLHALGIFPPAAPPTVRAFGTPRAADRRGAGRPLSGSPCQPVRDLLVDYLRERQPALDYASLAAVPRPWPACSGADLERRHPGHQHAAARARVGRGMEAPVTVKTIRTTGPDGQVTESVVPRP